MNKPPFAAAANRPPDAIDHVIARARMVADEVTAHTTSCRSSACTPIASSYDHILRRLHWPITLISASASGHPDHCVAAHANGLDEAVGYRMAVTRPMASESKELRSQKVPGWQSTLQSGKHKQ